MINQIKKTTIVSEHPLQSPQPVPTHHTDDMLTTHCAHGRGMIIPAMF